MQHPEKGIDISFIIHVGRRTLAHIVKEVSAVSSEWQEEEKKTEGVFLGLFLLRLGERGGSVTSLASNARKLYYVRGGKRKRNHDGWRDPKTVTLLSHFLSLFLFLGDFDMMAELK